MLPLELLKMTEKLPENWERADTETGIPYYIDHLDHKTYWDHPLFSNIVELLNCCDSIRYSAYRTAAKMRILQENLHFGQVRLSVVAGVFEQHGLTEAENESTLECGHLEAILHDIFFVAKTEVQAVYGKQFNQNIASELTLNLLLNTFDLKRKGNLKLMDVKVVLAFLCCGLTDPAIFVHRPCGREKWAQDRLTECYRFLFFQACGGRERTTANRSNLNSIFYALTAFIGGFLKESRAFGLQYVPGTLLSLFHQGCDQMISEEDFLKWLNSGPRLLVWFTTLHRMMVAESVKHHGVRCTLCKTSSIVGLRFRCLSCLMHDQCQDCFLHGKTNGKHKLSHPMYEYCLPTTGKEDRQALVKTLKNKVKSARLKIHIPRDKLEGSIWERRYVSYMDDEQSDEAGSFGDIGETQLLIQEMEMTSKIVKGKQCGTHSANQEVPLPPRYPKEELSSIIGHLEEGHRDLGEQIEGLYFRERGGRVGLLGMCMRGSDEMDLDAEERVCRQLQGTREQLEEQVKRLKALQACLQKIQPSLNTATVRRQPQCRLESTPMPVNHQALSLAKPLPILDDLSPITDRKLSAEVQVVQPSYLGDKRLGVISPDPDDNIESPSCVEFEVDSQVNWSQSFTVLTEVSPEDLSTVLMARWKGGLKNSTLASRLGSPSVASILRSPVHPCLMSQRKCKKGNAELEETQFAEVQRDLDWVLGELDAMLVSQISESNSSQNSDCSSNPHDDSGDTQENKKLCKAATQLEDLLAGLIKVVEVQKKNQEAGASAE